MRRKALVIGGLLAVAGTALGQSASPDSARAALQAELEALRAELERPPGEDPFEDGDRQPDLVIVSTHSLLGEVSPCG